MIELQLSRRNHGLNVRDAPTADIAWVHLNSCMALSATVCHQELSVAKTEISDDVVPSLLALNLPYDLTGGLHYGIDGDAELPVDVGDFA